MSLIYFPFSVIMTALLVLIYSFALMGSSHGSPGYYIPALIHHLVYILCSSIVTLMAMSSAIYYSNSLSNDIEAINIYYEDDYVSTCKLRVKFYYYL